MNKRIIDDITRFIFVEDEMEKADAIFIPGGSHPELGEYAAALYNQGYAKVIIPTGGFSVKHGKFAGVKSKRDIYCKDYLTECEFLTDVLMYNGVPREAIVCETASGWTRDNAFLTQKAADEHGLRVEKAILCCKCFHARRSLMWYQMAFPDVDILVHPIPYFQDGIEISADNWHTTPAGIQRVLGELQRLGGPFADDFLALIPSEEAP